MTDPTSDITFRPESGPAAPREREAREAVVREELMKLRRRSPRVLRVVPASRRPMSREPGSEPPAA